MMEEIKNCIEKVSRFLDRAAGVADKNGVVFAATDAQAIGQEDPAVKVFVHSADDKTVADGKTYIKIELDDKLVGAAFVEGTDVVSANYLELLACWIDSALHERNTEAESEGFLKNVLLENELPGDIPLKAREFKITYAQPRLALLISLDSVEEFSVRSFMADFLKQDANDFVLPMDEENFVVLLDLNHYSKQEINEIPEKIYDALSKELPDATLHIGVGMVTETLKDVSKSYREASLALTVGKIFEDEQNIMRYNRLGLGRLIYQLPPTLCQMFLSEVFAPDTYEALDPETLVTIQKFFENNLNGSETSRQLFVHRNTLVYRLDKVQKITGLDLRSFDDAVLFKLAAMVRKYLESLQANGTFNTMRKWS